MLRNSQLPDWDEGGRDCFVIGQNHPGHCLMNDFPTPGMYEGCTADHALAKAEETEYVAERNLYSMATG